jgi:hypothetical protein
LRLEKEKAASGTLARLGTATAWLWSIEAGWNLENPQKLEGLNGKIMGQYIINSDLWIAYGSENPTIYFDEFPSS